MKPNTRMSLLAWTLSGLLMAQLACSILGSPTPPPLWQGLTMSSTVIDESGTGPDYTVHARVPVLQGSDDARVIRFNQEMAALVQQDIESFKLSLQDLPAVPISAGSFFDMDFEVKSPAGPLLSLKFTISWYADGAAHPGTTSRTVTYDLESGADVNLDQLFLPGSDFLGVIADFCKAELAGRDIAFDAQITGADPTADNYRNWNVTAEGLLITFDEYQVAAYAAGRQEVLIPYADLAAVVDSDGLLAGLLP